MIYTYTSTLVAFLTVPTIQNLIESLEELANQREILWTYVGNTAHQSLFGVNNCCLVFFELCFSFCLLQTASPPGTYFKIGQLIRERPDLLVKTSDEGVEAVLDKNMAFIKEKSYLDFMMEQDFLETRQCRLSQVPQIFFSAGFGWVLEEESVFLPIFNDE